MRRTRAQLKRQLREALAGQAFVYKSASDGISKASIDHMMGSGVVLTLTALGGREVIIPVMIRDGLSEETIRALQSDIRRSYELATFMKPEGC